LAGQSSATGIGQVDISHRKFGAAPVVVILGNETVKASHNNQKKKKNDQKSEAWLVAYASR